MLRCPGTLCRLAFATSFVAGLVSPPLPGEDDDEGPAPSSLVPQSVAHLADASPLEVLAAREVCRYVYLTAGTLLPVQAITERPPPSWSGILVARKDRKILPAMIRRPGLRALVTGLGPEEYVLRTLETPRNRIFLVVGGDDAGTLFAAYSFAEHLGVRFYLHGDVVPDRRVEARLPAIAALGKPLFALRGIQPFHDFPEGPDWWNADDYKAILAQLPKLRMNFFGLHTYPEGGPNAEPAVWIGLPSEVGEGTAVKASYPSSWMNTLRGNWGYAPKRTGEYLFGAAALFDRDDYGADVMRGACPQPEADADCDALFARAGDLLRDAFTFARGLGVKVCLGTETPLTVPKRVQDRLRAAGKDPKDPAVVRELYEGIFRRAAQAYPLDWYWFWTPEGWTWEGASSDRVKSTVQDMGLAIEAWRTVAPPFRLATCGWVLGPQDDRALFDKILPPGFAVSCINRQVGNEPVDPGFAGVGSRPKWAIPWLEDDPGLTSPQLWVGRMRRDAADARRYGCTGLMGIHWRTRVLAPNVLALARAAWTQEPWNRDPEGAPPPQSYRPTDDFYADWASSEFGPEVGPEAARIFVKMDGALPRPADWVDGPGGTRPDPRPWEEVAKEYAFVEELATLRLKVAGAGSLERFDWWTGTFRYMRAMAQVRCAWAEVEKAMEGARKEADPAARARAAREAVMPLRRKLVGLVAEVWARLLETVSNPGEMGTVMNWEQHILPSLLEKPGVELEALLGEKLPPDAVPWKEWRGPSRAIVPTVRTSVGEGEGLEVAVIVLSKVAPTDAAVLWRPFGGGDFRRVPLVPVARGVHTAALPAEATSGVGLEYFVRVVADGGTSVFPATAPGACQTVVVVPKAR